VRLNVIAVLVCLSGVLLVSDSVAVEGQEGSQSSFFVIEGLQSTYDSCSQVQFSVRNTSRQEIDVEVYVEDLKSGSWVDVDCQYDINHPRSEHAKLGFKNRQLLPPGDAVALTYDRCSAYERCARKAFGKNDERSFRRFLETEDAAAVPTPQQRLKVIVHVRENGHFKLVDKEPSQPFSRVPSKKTVQTPNR